MIKHLTTHFNWDKKTRTMTAFASDLGTFIMDSRQFILESHLTGNKITFELTKIDRDVEGDIQAWEFLPVRSGYESNTKFVTLPPERNIKVVIFND